MIIRRNQQLTKDQAIDPDLVDCAGWIEHGKPSEAPDGYNCFDYIKGNRYLGRDEYGIEPIFDVIETSELAAALGYLSLYRNGSGEWCGVGAADPSDRSRDGDEEGFLVAIDSDELLKIARELDTKQE
ncbi:hypothetical protein LOC67_23330 [Stieleria sp. JC731]|uniref:hypothetical protein n=1 Tax=Pirellulaceae TaxID=2691357 RepID=UPI001E517F99|nr:hypothetical protein [Stieleria sp. JC731]MCC9603492.1 hypothetical protein [Stieleria sp. JC731]